MLFSSITFIYVFLPVVLILYYLAPRKLKNYVLLIASLLFYFFGEPIYVLLLVLSSLLNWLHGLYIEAHRGDFRRTKIALVSCVIVNLALLGFFKYADFLIGSVNGLLGTAIPLIHVELPIGISFFTFQIMSYTIDVYRGRIRAQRNPATVATFVSLFPQLIAGPIVRYTDIASEMDERKITLNEASLGIRRFAFGLGKKVLIANALGELCAVFRATDEKSVLFYWLNAIAFTLQIYFDFSGYSDMAIGMGHMMGFHFPENFDYPYLSRSITEFWRRWHMTLGGWFRDYVYIPLGGSRTDKRWKWFRNIAVVWLLTGLWHGAAWNFVLWGALFGVLLIIEKLWLGRWLERVGRVLPHLYVMLLVTISFVIFNGDGLSGALADLSGMLGISGIPLYTGETLYYLRSYAVLLAAAAVGATPLAKRLYGKIADRKLFAVLEPPGVAALLLLCTAFLVDGSFNPFLYFRF